MFNFELKLLTALTYCANSFIIIIIKMLEYEVIGKCNTYHFILKLILGGKLFESLAEITVPVKRLKQKKEN